METYIWIFAIMTAAGMLGGAVNHFLSQETNPDQKYFGRSLWVGMAASYMVPLFLNMISSNLIDSIRAGDKSKLFVFAGFCLVAAISSRAFIRTLSDRVLREAKEAKEQAIQANANVAEVRMEIEPIVAKETEAETPAKLEAMPAGLAALNEDEKTILNVLANGRYALRTVGGLATETNIEKMKLVQMIRDLTEKKLVGMRLSD